MFNCGTLLAALVITFVCSAQAKVVCEGGFLLHGSYCYGWGDNAYGPGTFEYNEFDCDRMDSTLVSIHNAQENDYVSGFYDDINIGLHTVAGILEWTDGSPVEYKNFAAGQENHPIECVQMIKGLWYNVNCSAYATGYVCKKKSVEVPDTPANECPSADIIYSDSGTVYSPGYPDYFKAPPELVCTYKLKGQDGYRVTLEADIMQLSYGGGYLEFYEGWTASPDKLLRKTDWFEDTISTNETNMMLVVFHGQTSGEFKLTFYTDPFHTTTGDPSKTTPVPVITPNCPAQNEFGETTDLTSPGFPFVYEANTNCLYFFRGPHWEFHILALNLGADDYINFIDLRNNAVFATTLLNVEEGTEIKTDFSVAIQFKSGAVQGMFSHWRIEAIAWW